MSTHKTSKKSLQTEKSATEEISEMPVEEISENYPDQPSSATSKRLTQADLNAAVESNPPKQHRSSFSHIRQVWNSKGKILFFSHVTRSRERFLSLDSSDVFQPRSGNSNRRSSWYGGNIRNASLRKHSKTQQSNPSHRCSKASVQTLDSDGLPVHCGRKFEVMVDVHRTASGTPVDPGVGKVKSQKRERNVIIGIDPLEDARMSYISVPENVVDNTELYQFNGRFCKWWLRRIDKMTRPCPGCSKHLGPVLITVSLVLGFAIVVTLCVLFSVILTKLRSWWA